MAVFRVCVCVCSYVYVHEKVVSCMLHVFKKFIVNYSLVVIIIIIIIIIFIISFNIE